MPRVPVQIPDEKFKILLIGVDGRSIQCFQRETGTELIIDDSPGMILISSDDPEKLPFAQKVLERLVKKNNCSQKKILEVVKFLRQ